MVFNLASLKQDNVLVTNTDEAFIGTSVAESPFAIEVKRLTKVEKIDTIGKSLDADGNISNGEYSKVLFINSIASTEGFQDENGNELTLEDGVREIIWEYAPDILVDKVKKIIEDFNGNEEKKSEVQ